MLFAEIDDVRYCFGSRQRVEFKRDYPLVLYFENGFDSALFHLIEGLEFTRVSLFRLAFNGDLFRFIRLFGRKAPSGLVLQEGNQYQGGVELARAICIATYGRLLPDPDKG